MLFVLAHHANKYEMPSSNEFRFQPAEFRQEEAPLPTPRLSLSLLRKMVISYYFTIVCQFPPHLNQLQQQHHNHNHLYCNTARCALTCVQKYFVNNNTLFFTSTFNPIPLALCYVIDWCNWVLQSLSSVDIPINYWVSDASDFRSKLNTCIP